MCGTVAWLEGKTYRDDEQFDLAAWFPSHRKLMYNLNFNAFFTGQIIEDARKKANITQEELAARIGTNKSYISRIENGSVEPGAGMFLRILSALGLRFEVSQPLVFG
jgi:DNA-binding XRE family transcriptional regulator